MAIAWLLAPGHKRIQARVRSGRQRVTSAAKLVAAGRGPVIVGERPVISGSGAARDAYPQGALSGATRVLAVRVAPILCPHRSRPGCDRSREAGQLQAALANYPNRPRPCSTRCEPEWWVQEISCKRGL